MEMKEISVTKKDVTVKIELELKQQDLNVLRHICNHHYNVASSLSHVKGNQPKNNNFEIPSNNDINEVLSSLYGIVDGIKF